MTEGFYKLHKDNLLHAPNFVESPTYALYKENKDDYTYPVDGWYWFESLEEAQNFFGIEPEEESEIII